MSNQPPLSALTGVVTSEKITLDGFSTDPDQGPPWIVVDLLFTRDT